MSGKYNTKHPERGTSHYPERLYARHLKTAPRMAVIDGDTGLRARQERRTRERGHPWNENALPASELQEDAA